MTANFQTAQDLFEDWQSKVLEGDPPIYYRVGEGELARLEIGPESIMLVGGAPGCGKTAFTMQATVDALRLNPNLKALVCNVEMSPEALLARQLARLSGVDLGTIRHRSQDVDDRIRMESGLATLATITNRLAFLSPPFHLENVAASVDAFNADLLVLDYIQRILPPEAGSDRSDRRGAVDATMDYLRQFAHTGMALLVVAAVARGKDVRGRSTYSGDALTMASFRESSELEYGADNAYLLVPDESGAAVILRHLKARHSETHDIALRFDRQRQHFSDPVSAFT